jgi:group I intron endonuclease
MKNLPKNLPKLKISVIYMITNIINGKIYIGSATNYKVRMNLHFSLLNRNKHHSIILQRSYNKYGSENFECDIIEYCDINNLIEREQVWINFFKPEFNINKVAGSAFKGRKHSEETKKIMSEKHKGHKHYGPFIHTDETKIKMSELRIGSKNSNAKGVYIDDVYFGSLKEAAEHLNVHYHTIKNRIKSNKYNYKYEK